jgi:hypothetical protein
LTFIFFSKDLFAIQRNESAVHDLVFIEEMGDLLVAQGTIIYIVSVYMKWYKYMFCTFVGDGSAFQIPTILTSNISQASQEFIGFDMDPIYSIRVINNGRSIYAAGRDGSLRRF